MTTPAIATPLTARGRGAIAVIAVRGSNAHACVLQCFRPATKLTTAQLPIAQIRYGDWLGPDQLGPNEQATAPPSADSTQTTQQRAGEGVVVIARSKRVVEVHCHGGTAAVDAILADLQQVGVLVEPTESARRAPASDGHASDTFTTTPVAGSARSWLWRIVEHTNTDWTAGLALAQARGALDQWALTTANSTQPLPALEALEQIRDAATALLPHVRAGKHLVDPWNIVVAGPPNVGKSTLLNRLLGYRRAITFDQPGTTRDVLSAETAIHGWPVQLSDTAGLRTSDDAIESAGVTRAQQVLGAAELILLVTDAREGLTTVHQQILDSASAPTILVHNKQDLLTTPDAAARDPSPKDNVPETKIPTCRISATSGLGIPELLATIESCLIPSALRMPHIVNDDSATPNTESLLQLPAIPIGPEQTSTVEQLAQAETLEQALELLDSLRHTALSDST